MAENLTQLAPRLAQTGERFGLLLNNEYLVWDVEGMVETAPDRELSETPLYWELAEIAPKGFIISAFDGRRLALASKEEQRLSLEEPAAAFASIWRFSEAGLPYLAWADGGAYVWASNGKVFVTKDENLGQPLDAMTRDGKLRSTAVDYAPLVMFIGAIVVIPLLMGSD